MQELQNLKQKCLQIQYPQKDQQFIYQKLQTQQENQQQVETKQQKRYKSPTPIIGIDFGTSRSIVGYYYINSRGNKRLEIVSQGDGIKSIPSMIYISGRQVYFGNDAISMSQDNPKNLIYDLKRMIGHKYLDDDIQNMMKYWTFDIQEASNGDILICIDGKKYEVYKIIGKMLHELLCIANDNLESKTSEVILTIPANFNYIHKNELRKAALDVGIEIVQFLQEPIAATLTYGYQTLCDPNMKKKKILVYDLGGGTLDVSLVDIYDNNKFEVLSVGGDMHLGGTDFTNCIYDYISRKIDQLCQNSWKKDQNFIGFVKRRCEEAKIKLSKKNSEKIMIEIPPRLVISRQKVIEITITRKEFEEIAKPLIDKCMIPVIKLMENMKSLDDIILIGGSSYIPIIEEQLKRITKKNTSHGACHVEAVANGACVLAGSILMNEYCNLNQNLSLIEKRDLYLYDMDLHMTCPSTIAIELTNTTINLISKGKQYPYEKEISISSNELRSQKNERYFMIPIYEILNEKEKNKIVDIKLKNNVSNLFKKDTSLFNIKFFFSSNSIEYCAKPINGKYSNKILLA